VSQLAVDGVTLHYEVDGSPASPPLLFINSLGTDLRMWNAQVEAVQPHFRVIRFDCRGHGESGRSDSPLTVERLAWDAIALLDELKISSAHMCGLSLGGLIVMQIAGRHEGRVQRAVFANTATRIGTQTGWDARIAAVRAGGMAAVRSVVVARFLSEAFRQAEPESVMAVEQMLKHTDPEGYVQACAAIRDADLREAAGRITAPSLVIAGSLDEATTPAQAESLRDTIRGARLETLDAAHLSNVERPEEFSQLLLSFLRK
jgi:3-oxoadipate enol-lactonase